MNLRHQTLIDFPPTKIAHVLTQGFTGYFFPIQFSEHMLFQMIQRHGVDLSSSYMICDGDSYVGVALIGRRGWISRLAAMSIVPEYRGKGIGSYILKQLVIDSKQRQDHSIVLEVIEKNEPGIKLYQKFGFVTQNRLLGFTQEAPSFDQGSKLEEISLTELAQLVFQYGIQSLPWQISAETLANSSTPIQAYTLDSAFIALSDPQQEEITIHSLLVLPEARDQGKGQQILKSAMQLFPDKTWKIPAICPEELGGFFEKMGFKQQEISQLQMELKH